MKDVLFATSNKSKLQRFSHYYKPLGINVLSPEELKIIIDVEENGKTPEENATIKAKVYHQYAQIPTFAVDYGLRIERFPKENQPGVNVRRIPGFDKRPSDDNLLDYYTKHLSRIGGESMGEWTTSIALITADGKTHTGNFKRKTVFSSQQSEHITPDEPLNSIQIDPDSGKYFSELSKKEWLTIQQRGEKRYIEFMKEHLDEL